MLRAIITPTFATTYKLQLHAKDSKVFIMYVCDTTLSGRTEHRWATIISCR